MSYAPEVIADSSGKWCGNALRFGTREEAERQVSDLSCRWFAVRETRVVESTDPVNYRYVDGKLERVPQWWNVGVMVREMGALGVYSRKEFHVDAENAEVAREVAIKHAHDIGFEVERAESVTRSDTHQVG